MTTNSRVSNSIRNCISVIIYQLLAMTINLFVRKIMLDYVGVYFVGIDGILVSLFGMTSILEFGTSAAAAYFFIKSFATNDLSQVYQVQLAYKRILKFITVITLLFIVIIYFNLHYFVNDINSNITLIHLVFLFYAIDRIINLQYLSYYLVVFFNEKSSFINYINMILDLILGLSNIVFLIITQNYIVFVFLFLMKTVFRFIMVKAKSNKIIGKHSKNFDLINHKKDEIIDYAKRNFINSIFNIAYTYKDNIIISLIFSGTATIQIGLLSNYTALVTTVSGLMIGIITALNASISNYINTLNDNNQDEMKNIMQILITIAAIISSVAAIGLFSMTNIFVREFYGAEYVLPQIFIFVMVINLVVTIFQQMLNLFITSNGLLHYQTKYSVIIFVSVLSISIFLALNYGIIGVVVGTFIGSIIRLYSELIVIYQFILKNLTEIIIKLITFISYIVLGLFVFNLIASVNYIESLSFLGTLLVAICYGLLFLIPFLLSKNFRFIYKLIRSERK